MNINIKETARTHSCSQRFQTFLLSKATGEESVKLCLFLPRRNDFVLLVEQWSRLGFFVFSLQPPSTASHFRRLRQRITRLRRQINSSHVFMSTFTLNPVKILFQEDTAA